MATNPKRKEKNDNPNNQVIEEAVKAAAHAQDPVVACAGLLESNGVAKLSELLEGIFKHGNLTGAQKRSLARTLKPGFDRS